MKTVDFLNRRGGLLLLSLLVFGIFAFSLKAETISDSSTKVLVSVQQSSGQYMVSSKRFQWTFSGSVGAPLLNLQKIDGRDGIGSFQALVFQWKDAIPLQGTIRLYTGRPVILFDLTVLKEAGKPAPPFPDFSKFPQLQPFSFEDRPFSPPAFDQEENATPWLFFDKKDRAFLISPASDFMIARMTGAKINHLTSGLNPGVHQLPEGFRQQTLLVLGKGINRVWDIWGHALTDLQGKKRPANDADVGLKYLGYWTDNGATYYYNYDVQKGYEKTLLDLMAYYRKQGLPFRYLQLDSWWYPKTFTSPSGKKPENPHPRNPKMPKGIWNRYGGMLKYEAAPDVFPDGLGEFHEKLVLPLITHNRWIDVESPYRSTYKISGVGAVDSRWWDDVIGKIASWGVVTYEQDWLSAIYNNSPEMEITTWAGEAFMDNMARANQKYNMTMQYCMAQPRHFLQGSRYGNLTTIRVSGDRFKKARWINFLFTSRLASALGIYPWTDVYRSWEVPNMLLATLSAGMVGPGDPIGKEDPVNIFRAVRRDGVIVKPDVPLVPTDESFLRRAEKRESPVVGFTDTNFGGQKIYYFFTWNPGEKTHKIVLPPKSLQLKQSSVLYNYFSGEIRVLKKGKQVKAKLAARNFKDKLGAKKTDDWEYWILSPVGKSGIALIGDAGKFITAGKERINRLDAFTGGLKTEVLFAKGEREIELLGFAKAKPQISVEKGQANLLAFDKKSGLFRVEVSPDPRSPWQKTPHGDLIKTVPLVIERRK